MTFPPIQPGGHGPACSRSQRLFRDLSAYLTEVEDGPVDGLHTGASVRNVVWLQRMLGLPQTGVLTDHLLFHLTGLCRLCRMNLPGNTPFP